jgi:hypothetical protein
MREICLPDAVVEGTTCPFAESGYQIMRNIAMAAQLGRTRGTEWRVVFAFPASRRRLSVAHVAAVRELLAPEHVGKVSILDYDDLHRCLANSVDARSAALAKYMGSRLELVRPE